MIFEASTYMQEVILQLETRLSETHHINYQNMAKVDYVAIVH